MSNTFEATEKNPQPSQSPSQSLSQPTFTIGNATRYNTDLEHLESWRRDEDANDPYLPYMLNDRGLPVNPFVRIPRGAEDLSSHHIEFLRLAPGNPLYLETTSTFSIPTPQVLAIYPAVLEAMDSKDDNTIILLDMSNGIDSASNYKYRVLLDTFNELVFVGCTTFTYEEIRYFWTVLQSLS